MSVSKLKGSPEGICMRKHLGTIERSKILIIDDNEGVRHSLARFLKSKNYETESAESGKEGLQKATEQKYDAILLDLVMPDMSGFDTLIELKKICPSVKVIMMTGFASINNAVEAIKKGAYDYIQKPVNAQELDALIGRCIEESRFVKASINLDLDFTLSSLSNPLRRKIIKLLKENRGMHLMDMTRELAVTDHTKVVFHLKMLKESKIIRQDDKKGYFLTREGERTHACLRIIENQLTVSPILM